MKASHPIGTVAVENEIAETAHGEGPRRQAAFALGPLALGTIALVVLRRSDEQIAQAVAAS